MEIIVNNAAVYVATGGKEFDPSLPTVLFLHGSGGDHRTWALQTRWFAGPDAHMGGSSVPGMQPIAISRAIMSRNPLAADLQACADFTKGDVIVASLTIPRHCILATADKMTPLKAGLALAKTMDVTPTIIADRGHMLPLEAPKQTLVALRDFINSVQTERSAA